MTKEELKKSIITILDAYRLVREDNEPVFFNIGIDSNNQIYYVE